MVTVVPKSADSSSCLGLAPADRVGVGGADGGPGDQLLSATRVVHERKVRREIANSNERKRMQSINAGFQSLRLLLPRNGPVDRLSKAAILQQAAEYISFLITERQQLLELNRQYIAATRCLPAKRRRGSDGELSDDGSSTVFTDQLSSKRRSPTSCDSTHSRSLPIKKRKDEMAVSSSGDPVCWTRGHSSVSRRNLATIVEAIRHLEGDRFYCGTKESFEGSQSGDSDGDDASMIRESSSVICDNAVSQYTCLPDTPEDLSLLRHARLFLPVSADKAC